MAVTAPFDATESGAELFKNIPVEADTIIYGGTIGAIDDAGNAVPAADQANIRVLGRTEQNIGGVWGNLDNQNGAAGAITGNFKRGAFVYNNSEDNPVGPAQVGRMVYIQDAETVCTLAGSVNKVVAGMLIGFDPESGNPVVDFRIRPTTEITPD